jgi:hypothetical protein
MDKNMDRNYQLLREQTALNSTDIKRLNENVRGIQRQTTGEIHFRVIRKRIKSLRREKCLRKETKSYLPTHS